MGRGRWILQIVVLFTLVAWAVIDRERLIDEHGFLVWLLALAIFVGCTAASGYLVLRHRNPGLFEAPDLRKDDTCR